MTSEPTAQPAHRTAVLEAMRATVRAAEEALRIDKDDPDDDGAWRQYWIDILHEIRSFAGNQWRIMTDDDLCEECQQPRDGCICLKEGEGDD